MVGIALCIFGKPKSDGAVQKNEEEERIAEIVSAFNSVNDPVVIVYYDKSNNTETGIRGIAIIADGAESSVIQKKILDVLSAVYGLPSNRISVCGKK